MEDSFAQQDPNATKALVPHKVFVVVQEAEGEAEQLLLLSEEIQE